ncbi:MAG: hypothetical protein STSR0004_15290 [Peptococcaceae bacterium]
MRYSFAHGDKDGYPYPVNRQDYDRSISMLENALRRARTGDEDLSTGGPGQGGQVEVSGQYEDKGIIFNGPVALDYSKGLAIPDFTRSGTKAIEQCYAKEFCTTPIEMSFTRPQSRVKVWVGYSAGIDETREVYLIAYDKDGNYVGKARETLTLQGELLPIRTPLEVTSAGANISRAVVSFSLSNIPSEWPIMSHLAVDNVEFETAGPPSEKKRPDLAIWYIVIFTVFAATIISKYVINKRKPRLPINIETRGGVEWMHEPESQQYPVSMEIKGGVERL